MSDLPPAAARPLGPEDFGDAMQSAIATRWPRHLLAGLGEEVGPRRPLRDGVGGVAPREVPQSPLPRLGGRLGR